MAFPESFLQELAERNDIVDVVSGYVRLTKKSGSNLFGLCPFHSEKTPSFSVSPDKQIYHCFGCGKGGSVISFIMEIENLSFPEAVAFLANRAGMQLPEQSNDPGAKKRQRLLALNRDAARFFHAQLKTPAGQPARDYLARRQLTAQTVTRFGLGFAPDTWDSLVRAMKALGYSEQELFDGGLVRHGRSGGVYDTFRNRLMFPVIDVRGNVIGFSGRILGDGEPKYMNSPETIVFSKSHNLFALNLAKKSKCGYIILAEGNIDVASLHQAGFDSAVASLGTSLTPEQARLLSRYTSEIVIAYDNDGAGQKASQRAIGILEKLEVRVRVLQMQGAKGPRRIYQDLRRGRIPKPARTVGKPHRLPARRGAAKIRPPGRRAARGLRQGGGGRGGRAARQRRARGVRHARRGDGGHARRSRDRRGAAPAQAAAQPRAQGAASATCCAPRRRCSRPGGASASTIPARRPPNRASFNSCISTPACSGAGRTCRTRRSFPRRSCGTFTPSCSPTAARARCRSRRSRAS